MKKDKTITKIIDLINKTFGVKTFIIRDYWNQFNSIGLEKNKKLIFISTWHSLPDKYFYECEILLDDPDKVYSSYSTEDNVSTERLLEVIENFFEIKKK